jgi:hypothetical protein
VLSPDKHSHESNQKRSPTRQNARLTSFCSERPSSCPAAAAADTHQINKCIRLASHLLLELRSVLHARVQTLGLLREAQYACVLSLLCLGLCMHVSHTHTHARARVHSAHTTRTCACLFCRSIQRRSSRDSASYRPTSLARAFEHTHVHMHSRTHTAQTRAFPFTSTSNSLNCGNSRHESKCVLLTCYSSSHHTATLKHVKARITR